MAEDKSKKTKQGKTKQKWLTGGIPMFTRSMMYKKTFRYRIKKNAVKKEEQKKKDKYLVKEIGGEKNGGTRKVPINKQPRYYDTQVGRRKLKGHRKPFKEHKRRLRPSITPGTVLILLAGINRGRRVVFLKQLDTGLLLVNGPFAVNGIPFKRVNQRYVIATKTKIDISGVEIDPRITDAFLKRKKLRTGKNSKNIFDDKKETYQVSDERKEIQQKLDEQMVPLVKKVKNRMMVKYLQNPWSIRAHQYPHTMVF